DSPGDRAQLTGHGARTLTDVGDELAARLACGQQPFRWTEDTDRADVASGAIGDRRGDRHLSRGELADLGCPTALDDPAELTLETLRIADRRVGERPQALTGHFGQGERVGC